MKEKLLTEELQNMRKLSSENIQDMEYDTEKHLLVIIFKKNGRKYQYYQVPIQIWNGIKAAESKGKYFNAEIRDVFPFKEIK